MRCFSSTFASFIGGNSPSNTIVFSYRYTVKNSGKWILSLYATGSGACISAALKTGAVQSTIRSRNHQRMPGESAMGVAYNTILLSLSAIPLAIRSSIASSFLVGSPPNAAHTFMPANIYLLAACLLAPLSVCMNNVHNKMSSCRGFLDSTSPRG